MDFPGLDPIKILDYPLADVIPLMVQYMDRKRRTERQAPTKTVNAPPGWNTEKVIYREADDSWF